MCGLWAAVLTCELASELLAETEAVERRLLKYAVSTEVSPHPSGNVTGFAAIAMSAGSRPEPQPSQLLQSCEVVFVATVAAEFPHLALVHASGGLEDAMGPGASDVDIVLQHDVADTLNTAFETAH